MLIDLQAYEGGVFGLSKYDGASCIIARICRWLFKQVASIFVGLGST